MTLTPPPAPARRTVGAPPQPLDPECLVDGGRMTVEVQGLLDYWHATAAGRGFVYAIQALDGGPVKIGMTYDARARLLAIQHGNPRPLTIRAVMLGWAETERRLHARWRAYRLRGEWFNEDAASPLIAFVRGAGLAQVAAHEGGQTNTSYLANTLPFQTP